MLPPQVCRLSIANFFFFGIGPRVPELGPKMWSKLGQKCRISASNCPIGLKFGVYKYFLIALPPLRMSQCSKSPGNPGRAKLVFHKKRIIHSRSLFYLALLIPDLNQTDHD